MSASSSLAVKAAEHHTSISSSPAVANGVVYIGSDDNDVYALNASTGTELWSFKTSGAIESSPTVANGVVFFGSGDDHLYALNASTGTQLWSIAAGGPVQASPAVANGVVYVGSNDDRLYALDASSGSELWRFTTGDAVTSSPAVSNSAVYVGSGDGRLYAFGLAGGLASTVAANWDISLGFTTVRRLTVNAVPRHGKVVVTCAGRSCPFGQKTVHSPSRVVALAGLFGPARLHPRARIQISITAPHALRKVITYAVRPKAPPFEVSQCTASEARTKQTCA